MNEKATQPNLFKKITTHISSMLLQVKDIFSHQTASKLSHSVAYGDLQELWGDSIGDNDSINDDTRSLLADNEGVLEIFIHGN